MMVILKETLNRTLVNKSLLFHFTVDFQSDNTLDAFQDLLKQVHSRIEIGSSPYNEIKKTDIAVFIIPNVQFNTSEIYYESTAKLLDLAFENGFPYSVNLTPIDSTHKTRERSIPLDSAKSLVSNFFNSDNRLFVKLIREQKQHSVSNLEIGLNLLEDIEREKDLLIPLLLKLLGIYASFDGEIVFDIAKEFSSLKQVSSCLLKELKSEPSDD